MLKKTRAINRVSQIGDIILTDGFGYIRYNKNVEHCSTFISLFKQRMTDQFVQSMFAVFDNSPKCLLYKHVVSNSLCLQPIALKYKHILSKYRLSAHILSIETGRYHQIARNGRICSLCIMNILEDEYHFVVVCPFYSNIRYKYIKPFYYNTPSTFKLTHL